MGITTPPNIPESITILARDLQLLDNKHPMLSKEECDQLSALQAILNSRALLQCRMAREDSLSSITPIFTEEESHR
jgi:hypothetical protein